MALGDLRAENYLPYVKTNKGYFTKLPMSTTSTITATGGIVSAGGVSGNTEPTVFHSGGVAPMSSSATVSGGTNTTVVSTDTYSCEVFIPVNTTLTGISILNGTTVAGNIFVGLANSAGLVVASSATNVAGSGTSAYQAIPFSATYAAVGPAKYFILAQFSSGSARVITHTIGNFGAIAVTSETYGTFLTTAAYSTTTFTTLNGCVADTY